jgi:thiamine-monophosphate kinase
MPSSTGWPADSAANWSAGRAKRDAPTSDEFQLIARYFAPLAAGASGAFGLTDDAATLAVPSGRNLVVTVDMLVAEVHFLAEDPPSSIGAKVLGVNLSDLAAMGAQPVAYVLSIALPAAWGDGAVCHWLDGFTAGLAEMQVASGITLIGGDTVSTPGPLCLSVAAFGTVESGCELRRGGARPGDTVFVSGTIGDAAIGLHELAGRQPRLLEPGLAKMVVGRYRRPTPRVALGRALVGLASACADVSDGLVADLGHICEASGVAATIEAARVPLSEAGRSVLASEPAILPALITGGDDYELVFTASTEQGNAIATAAAAIGVPVSAIGGIIGRKHPDSPLVSVVGPDGQALKINHGGWRHF